MTRREFLRLLSLLGGAGLLQAAGLGVLLTGCRRGYVPDVYGQTWRPAYAALEEQGELQRRIDEAFAILESCELCPRYCRVNRLRGEVGFCQTPEKVVVHSHNPHFGEELPLVGSEGSGTIFFSHCNLRCVFCQNYPIAHLGWGREIRDEDLAAMMLRLQEMGCHNINVVTPTHVLPHILNATRIAYQKGLRLPLCYNTSGYERVEIIKMLDGIVDIYLPDLKFMDGDQASRYNLAAADDYAELTQRAIIEMHRQVGDLVTDRQGIAVRGLMVRHLVMPNRVAGTEEFVEWVAEHLSPDTYVNIMSQYRVAFMAFEYAEIARAISAEEFVEAMEWALDAGLKNLDQRSLAHLESMRALLGR